MTFRTVNQSTAFYYNIYTQPDKAPYLSFLLRLKSPARTGYIFVSFESTSWKSTRTLFYPLQVETVDSKKWNLWNPNRKFTKTATKTGFPWICYCCIPVCQWIMCVTYISTCDPRRHVVSRVDCVRVWPAWAETGGQCIRWGEKTASSGMASPTTTWPRARATTPLSTTAKCR